MNFWYRPPGALAFALWPLSLVYSLVVRAWHLAFSLGLRTVHRVEGLRVISVGNLVVGGSGKTPVVIALANAAAAAGHRVAVLSRGYGRRSAESVSFSGRALPPVHQTGDEPRLIARRCPEVTVWVGRDRVQLARDAARAGATLAILDDGFQHRRLARDVDLLVDAGLGNGRMLPAGPLREPPSHLRRATHRWGPGGAFEGVTEITGIRAPDGRRVADLKAQQVVLLTGIARPERVADTVKALGGRLLAHHAFGDHHPFSERQLSQVLRSVPPGASLVTTEKDAERLPEGFPAWVLELSVRVVRGDLQTLFG